MRVKRFLTAVLSVVLVLTMTRGAKADDYERWSFADGTLTIEISEETVTVTTYSVDVVWSNMALTYKTAEQLMWRPYSHSYQGVGDAAWVLSNNSWPTVVVTNHSNVPVDVSIARSSAQSTSGATYTFEYPNGGDSLPLAAGEEGNYSGAASGTITIVGDESPDQSGNDILVVTVAAG